jgi:hypothetical protein
MNRPQGPKVNQENKLKAQNSPCAELGVWIERVLYMIGLKELLYDL